MKSIETKILANSDFYTYQPSTLASKLYLYPLVVGHFFYEPGYDLHRNQYNSFLLMFIQDGVCVGSNAEGTLFRAEKNQMILLDCYHPHQYGNGDPEQILDVLWLHFDGPLARSFYEAIISGKGNVLSPSNGSPIRHSLSRILALFRESSPIREASVSEQITRILNHLLLQEQSNPVSSEPSLSQMIEDSVAYINEHFREELSLEQLSAHANLSPYYFSRVFAARTGYTPHQYLIAARIHSAKYLLQTPGISIKEICFACGFRSESSFCAVFKKWEHRTPGEFRQMTLRKQ